MTSNYFVKLHFNQAIAQKTNYAFKVGDKGCTFHLHCEDHDPTDMLPHIVFNRSDGTCVEGTPAGSGRDYTYTVQGNEFGVCGKTVVDLKFYDADPATQRISTASFIIDVIPDTLTPFDTPPSPYADSLERAKEELEDATEDLANMDSLFAQTLQDYIDAFGNTAPINPRGAYDPAALYKPRDAVYYTANNKTVTYMNNLECTGVLPTESSNWQPLFDIAVIPAIIDNCESTSTTDALAANQGRVLNENIEAIVDACSAKNILPVDATTQTINTVLFTIDDNKVITINGTVATTFAITLSSGVKIKAGDYALSIGTEGLNNALEIYSASPAYDMFTDSETIINIPSDLDSVTFKLWVNGGDTYNNVKTYPMLRDARITDTTFAPFAKTNLQLTNDKAERNDLSTIHATGSTNTTGAQINEGTFFYLNGQFCKATADIAATATFTINTNFKVESVGGVIQEEDISSQITVNTTYFNTSVLIAYKKMCNGLKWLIIYGQPITTLPDGTAFMSGFTPDAMHKVCPIWNTVSGITRFARIWVNNMGQLMLEGNLSTDDLIIYNDIIR